jgi:ribonuclease HI
MMEGAGAGLVFLSPLGVRMKYITHIHFPASNNVVEYEALLNGLQIAVELGIRCLVVKGDSRLVVDQVMKESGCLNPKMAAYCLAVRLLEEKFDGLELIHILRRFNVAADQLAKMGLQCQPVPHGIFVNDLYKPSVRFEEEGQPRVGPSDRGAGARPATPDPDPALNAAGTLRRTPHSPDPPGKGSGACGSASPLSDAEVMELDDEQVPAPDSTGDWRKPYIDYLL